MISKLKYRVSKIPFIKEYLQRKSVLRKVETSQSFQANLENLHIINCRLIIDRIELLRLVPKNKVVAEIGVDEGIFSEKIISITRSLKTSLD